METLTFHLEEFDGPLDVLLYLVSKNKINIYDIPILELIDQYTSLINGLQENRMEVASEFIEMAARLVQMKSFLLLPRSEEAERMKEELTGQLIEYSACKEVARQLGEQAACHCSFVRPPMELEQDNTYRLTHEANFWPRPWSCCWAEAGAARPRPTSRALSRWLLRPLYRWPAGWCMCCAALLQAGWQAWRGLFNRGEARSQTVATFLAVLELNPCGTHRDRRSGNPHRAPGPDKETEKLTEGMTQKEKEYKAAVEAILFAHGDAIGADKIAEALEISKDQTVAILEQLQKEYEKTDRGLCILPLGDKWQMATKTAVQEPVKRVLDNRRNTPLSQAALEVLAIIAYNQPVSRGFVEQVRGVDSSSTIAKLMEKGLVEEAGRLDLPGRPISLCTTEVFLRTFGLATLEQLPPLHEGNGVQLEMAGSTGEAQA